MPLISWSLAALTTAAIFAAADALIALPGAPISFSAPQPALAAFGMSYLVGLAGCLAGWLGLWPIAAVTRLDGGRLRLAWSASFVGGVTALGATYRLSPTVLRDPAYFAAAATLFAGVALVALLLYFTPLAAIGRGLAAVGASLAVALPAVWFAVYAGASSAVYLAFGLLVALAALVAGWFWNRAAMAAVASAGAVAAALGWGFFWWSPTWSFARAEVQRASDNPPSAGVLLITVDTLRQDALSIYNSRTRATPNFDRLAKDSIVFERAYSAGSWTVPAVASIHTGTPPQIHRRSSIRPVLPDSYVTLAEALAGAGYRTAAVVENPWLAPARPGVGLGQGFEFYSVYPRPGERSLGSRLINRRGRGAVGLTDQAIPWLESYRDEPYFFWLHHFEPHEPYAPPVRLLPRGKVPEGRSASFGDHASARYQFDPEPSYANWLHTLYLAEVQFLDEQIGRLLDSLEASGQYDDMLIVLTSDHGEEFWEHGGWEHGHSVYDEVVRVPLFLKLPGGPRGARISQPVTTASIAATILETLGVEDPESCYRAPSLEPLWQGSPQDYRAPVLMRSDNYGVPLDALVRYPLKAVKNLRDQQTWAFNLEDDPEELHQLQTESEAERDLLLTLSERQQALDQLRSCYVGTEQADQQLDEESQQRLRSLGYL